MPVIDSSSIMSRKPFDGARHGEGWLAKSRPTQSLWGGHCWGQSMQENCLKSSNTGATDVAILKHKVCYVGSTVNAHIPFCKSGRL